MSDYISREAAIELLHYNADERCSAVVYDFEEIPAADVEPVRHVPRKVWGIDEYYGEWLRCPNCGYEDNVVDATYCGGCGAKFDLEE